MGGPAKLDLSTGPKIDLSTGPAEMSGGGMGEEGFGPAKGGKGRGGKGKRPGPYNSDKASGGDRKMNSLGLPLNADGKPCLQYMVTGWCKWGEDCWSAHPDPPGWNKGS